MKIIIALCALLSSLAFSQVNSVIYSDEINALNTELASVEYGNLKADLLSLVNNDCTGVTSSMVVVEMANFDMDSSTKWNTWILKTTSGESLAEVEVTLNVKSLTYTIDSVEYFLAACFR